MFLVIRGNLNIELKDSIIVLSECEAVVIPGDVELCPVAIEEAIVMLVEPASTVNPGNIKSVKTLDAHWI